MPTSPRLLVATVAALALLAAACTDSDDDGAATTTTSLVLDGGVSDGGVDESAQPVRVGLIAQDEGLIAFPEIRVSAQAAADYVNAELGGVDGHRLELDVCGTGDAPESALACAQRFANDATIHLVIQGTVNTPATNDVFVGVGTPVMNLGNDVVDYVTPGVYTFDPGALGLPLATFLYAATTLGSAQASLFYADTPLFEALVPLFEALAAANGIEITESIPLGFEPDLGGTVAAADPASDTWFLAMADPAQCSAAAAAIDLVGFTGEVVANDLCMGTAVVASGAIDGWVGPAVSSAPTLASHEDVVEIVRILQTYAGPETERGGLAGWAFASVLIAHDVLGQAGAPDVAAGAVDAVLASYAADDILGMPPLACPGPGAFVGACNSAPLIVEVVDGELTQPVGFVEIDYTALEALLAG